MAIVLKDWYGKEHTYEHDKIFVKGENGERVQFTKGTGEPTLESLEVTENGNYTPSEGVDGFGSVSVNVPKPEAVLQDKTITENGTYSADSGYDGLGNVTVEVAGSGGSELEDFIKGTATEYENSNITTFRQYGFAYSGCKKISLPSCTTVPSNGFYYCKSLTEINLPNCTTVGGYGFYASESITTIRLPKCTSLNGNQIFGWCSKLTTLYLESKTVCSLVGSNHFAQTPIESIYVPSSLVSTYKSNSAWSTYASYIKAIP